MRSIVRPAVLLALAALVVPAAARTSRPQQLPVFRSKVVLLPVSVAVLDQDGRPITDLTKEHFTLLEDDVPQEIRAFAPVQLRPEVVTGTPAPLSVATSSLSAATSGALAPQTRRTFMILLGYGRIQDPTKAIDATLRFVRTQALPQDLISLLIFDRYTELSTNHAALETILGRYKSRHEHIVQEIDDFTSAPANLGLELPSKIRQEIDALFTERDPKNPSLPLPRMRDLDALTLGADLFRQSDRFLPPPRNDAARIKDDFNKVYGALDFLKLIDGEKHLIVCTKMYGIAGPSVQQDERLAARANDARVVMDLIHASGVPAFKGFPKQLTPASTVSNPTWVFGNASSERVAELTGGSFNGPNDASHVFDRVDATTRFQYLLGYSPANPELDGRYRKIVVKVDRPGVTLLYRHGYTATDEHFEVPTAERMASARMDSAASIAREFHEIGVTAQAALAPHIGLIVNVNVQATIDATNLAFTEVGGLRTATLRIRVYAGDATETRIGEFEETLNVSLNSEDYALAQRNGMPYRTRVPVTGNPVYIKVVVFDPSANLIGTALVKLAPVRK